MSEKKKPRYQARRGKSAFKSRKGESRKEHQKRIEKWHDKKMKTIDNTIRMKMMIRNPKLAEQTGRDKLHTTNKPKKSK
jgi:hypothetical protein